MFNIASHTTKITSFSILEGFQMFKTLCKYIKLRKHAE